MDPQKLEQALADHDVWVKSSGRKGTRANLQGANLQGADLKGANLKGANLQGANLQGANLQGTNLQGANLQGGNLHEANLHEANLHEANLHEVSLHGTNLKGTNLRWANLRWANLHGADLRGADLHGTNLHGANLHGANLRWANGIAVAVDSGDRLRAVACAATANDDSLEMDSWHTCETAHCIAGWAIHLAGEPGRLLEEMHGAELAGRMLLGHEAALHFHDTNEDARAWLLSVLDS